MAAAIFTFWEYITFKIAKTVSFVAAVCGTPNLSGATSLPERTLLEKW